jgi:hypothetical protein
VSHPPYKAATDEARHVCIDDVIVVQHRAYIRKVVLNVIATEIARAKNVGECIDIQGEYGQNASSILCVNKEALRQRRVCVCVTESLFDWQLQSFEGHMSKIGSQ